MAEFQIQRIAEGTYSILDAGGASFYVVEGSDLAAVIDTGITPGEKIMPIIRQLTEKPLILVITHAHLDHMHHRDEFGPAYMSHREFAMDPAILKRMTGNVAFDLHDTIDIHTGSVIDLGSEQLEICEVPGHTPGSVVVLAGKRNMLFTGDAIGSGCGVWMQVPGAVSLETYRESLIFLLKWLTDRGGRMTFWGGHQNQQFCSTAVPGYNPLTVGLLADMIDLTDGLVKGTIAGIPSNADKVLSMQPMMYAAFGRAEMQYDPQNIHKPKARPEGIL